MKNALLAATMLATMTSAALAHVGVTPSSLPTNQTALVGFGIGHGCDGPPTTTVRMQIPLGVISVQPVAKPGWEITITRSSYAAPQMNGTATVAEGVTLIEWTGGNLPDELYDQFWIRARVASNVAADTRLYFPMVQECPDGVHRWISIPVEGQPEPAEPAPGITVGAPAAAAGH
jgi:uncharacterized protein YcnI